MPKSSGDGIGLTISGYGSFILSGGSSNSYGNSGAVTDGANSAITYELSGTSGFGGGGSIGYKIAKGLGLVVGFDFRSLKTKTWNSSTDASPYNGLLRDLADSSLKSLAGSWGAGVAALSGGALCTTAANCVPTYTDFGKSTSGVFQSNSTFSSKWTNMVITLGIRPEISLLGGTFYGGAGAAIVLPYKSTTDIALSGKTGILASRMPNDATQTDEWGLGIGGYGEVGYTYNITDNVFAGIGAKVIMATANNKGLTRKFVANMPDGSVLTATYEMTDSVKESDKTLTKNGNDYTGKAGYQSQGITDITAQVIVGVRL